MLTILIILAILCAGLAVYFYKKDVFQFTIFFIMWSLFWGVVALYYFAEKEKTVEEKTDYIITLKQNYYILQSNTKTDTVVHGNLENFLINDNE